MFFLVTTRVQDSVVIFLWFCLAVISFFIHTAENPNEFTSLVDFQGFRIWILGRSEKGSLIESISKPPFMIHSKPKILHGKEIFRIYIFINDPVNEIQDIWRDTISCFWNGPGISFESLECVFIFKIMGTD